MALTYLEYQVMLVTLAWIGGFTPLFLGWTPRWRWWQCVGLGLVLTPFIRFGVGVYFDLTALIETTVTGGRVVLPAFTEAQLWTKAWRHVLYYLLIPGAGLLLVWRGAPRRRDLDEAGIAPKTDLVTDSLHGFTLFVFIATSYMVALTLAYVVLADVITATGDESQVWRNITVPLILVLSGVAGVTEELLFRGLMLRTLARAMPWGVAAVLQAVAFGLVHAGYMTWAHVLGPLAFGLGMAWVTRVLGIVPAVLLHAQVNIVFFSIGIAGVVPAALYLVAALVALNVYAAWRTRLRSVRLLWASLLAFFGRKKEAPSDGAV